MYKNLKEETKRAILKIQQNELDESVIYANLAKKVKNEKNRDILIKIGEDEKRHAGIWQEHTKVTLKPNKLKVFWYTLLNKFLGFTFAIRLMEQGEGNAQEIYSDISKEIEEAIKIHNEEQEHEEELIKMLDEEHLRYVGSIVLGLNDALVELTGALAGFTMAYDNMKLMAFSGLITGLAASFSMASSEYLSARTNNDPEAKKSAIYTGIAYLLTVVLLVAPYMVLSAMDVEGGKWIALSIMLTTVLLIIGGFNFYISVAKQLNFKRRFWEMATISLGVALFSFVIGLVVKQFIGL